MKIAAAIVFAGLATTGLAHAEVVAMTAAIAGSNEVPPTPSTASGTGEVELDTVSRQLSWKVKWAGLSAPLSATHFHGAVPATANAGILVPIPAPNTAAGEVAGSAVVTEQQVTDILAGRWYINMHTPNYPAGEIRGQVVRR